MADWIGFSDEDLRKVKQMAVRGGGSNNKKDVSRQTTIQHVQPVKAKPVSLHKERAIAPKPRPQTATSGLSVTGGIDSSMMLSRKPATDAANRVPHTQFSVPKQKTATATIADSSEHLISSSSGMCDQEGGSSAEPIKVELEDAVEVLDDQEALNRDLHSMEKFREQQKAIEEANKQKKALLAKTLSERQKKAKAEAYKLQHIQKELTKLDNLLTADVQVVRNKIETASREFLEAQRRYERAEKEFIESKLDLHKKSEIKEALTEHLYTIIHQNEVRKSRKLAELMKELEMNPDDEDLQLPELPPLTSFSNMNSLIGHHPCPKTPSPTQNMNMLNSLKSAIGGMIYGSETKQNNDGQNPQNGSCDNTEKPAANTVIDLDQCSNPSPSQESSDKGDDSHKHSSETNSLMNENRAVDSKTDGENVISLLDEDSRTSFEGENSKEDSQHLSAEDNTTITLSSVELETHVKKEVESLAAEQTSCEQIPGDDSNTSCDENSRSSVTPNENIPNSWNFNGAIVVKNEPSDL